MCSNPVVYDGTANERAYRIIKLGGLLTFLISCLTIHSVSQGTFRFNVKYVSYQMQYNYAALH